MLLDLNPFVQGILVVTRQNRNRPLSDDRTVIDPLIHEVNRHPRHLNPGSQRLADGVDSGEGRQQRRVDVEDSVGEPGDGLGPEDSHEPCQHQRLNADRFGNVANLLGECGSITTVRNQSRLDGVRTGALDGLAFIDIADHQFETWEPVVNQGLEVGAGATGENREVDDALL